MFGHQDNQNQDFQDDINQTAHTNQGQQASDAHSNTENTPWQHPGNPLVEEATSSDAVSPAGGFPEPLSSKNPVAPPELKPIPVPHPKGNNDNTLIDATDEDLLDIKHKALEELFPLIDKLNQTPEERFKTLMMIIQASDNYALIDKAYQVAQTIDEDKQRAEALLDIINEINYFTQQPEV